MNDKPKLKVRSSRDLKHKVAMSGMSIKEFANNVDISPSYASLILSQKANPSPTTASKITILLSKKLGINLQINDIFFDVRVKKNTT